MINGVCQMHFSIRYKIDSSDKFVSRGLWDTSRWWCSQRTPSLWEDKPIKSKANNGLLVWRSLWNRTNRGPWRMQIMWCVMMWWSCRHDYHHNYVKESIGQCKKTVTAEITLPTKFNLSNYTGNKLAIEATWNQRNTWNGVSQQR